MSGLAVLRKKFIDKKMMVGQIWYTAHSLPTPVKMYKRRMARINVILHFALYPFPGYSLSVINVLINFAV